MTRKLVMLSLALLSMVPSTSILLRFGVSPATSGYETIAQNAARAREVAKWPNAWCTSPRQAIDHRCSKIGAH